MVEKISGNSGLYKYYAFISYKNEDEKWAKWLHKKLETYKLPSVLFKKNKNIPRKLNPCFRYHTDIGIDELTAELHSKLEKSQYLIVVCSTKSAKSEWVGAEIEHFITLGRGDKIIPFIVDGVPYSNDDSECYHPVLKKYFPRTDSKETNHEILGANINEEGKGSKWTKRQKAFVKIVAKLHKLEFDDLWQRHKRRVFRQTVLSVLLVLAICIVMGSVIKSNQPKDVSIALNEITFHNNDLPPLKSAEITLFLDNDVRKDTLTSLQDVAIFPNVPAHFLGKQVKVAFKTTDEEYKANDYLAFDTVLLLQEKQQLNIHRNDSVYGYFSVEIEDVSGNPLKNTKVYLDGTEYLTNGEGTLECLVPLERQKEKYPINIKFSKNPDTISATYNAKGQYHKMK